MASELLDAGIASGVLGTGVASGRSGGFCQSFEVEFWVPAWLLLDLWPRYRDKNTAAGEKLARLL